MANQRSGSHSRSPVRSPPAELPSVALAPSGASLVHSLLGGGDSQSNRPGQSSSLALADGTVQPPPSGSAVANQALVAQLTALTAAMAAIAQQLQQQPSTASMAEVASAAAVETARLLQEPVAPQQPQPMDPSPVSLPDIPLEQLKKLVGSEVVASITNSLSLHKKALLDVSRFRQRSVKLKGDILALGAGNLPPGLKPFAAASGPPLFDEEVGSSLEFKITLPANSSFRDWKKRIHHFSHHMNLTIDDQLLTKQYTSLEKDANFQKFLETCSEHSAAYSKKFESAPGPPGLVSCSEEHAIELGTRLFRGLVIHQQAAIDKQETLKTKEELDRSQLISAASNMSAEQLAAAADWQRKAELKNVKFNSKVDYVKLSAASVPIDVKNPDAVASYVRAEPSKRRFSKAQLSERKAVPRATPATELGQNSIHPKGKKPSTPGKGKGKDSGTNKGKGKGKGPAKGKGKQGKSGSGPNAPSRGGKGGAGGKNK